MEHIVLQKFTELPKKNMFVYTADSIEEAVAKHLEMGGKQPTRVYLYFHKEPVKVYGTRGKVTMEIPTKGMYYMDTDEVKDE